MLKIQWSQLLTILGQSEPQPEVALKPEVPSLFEFILKSCPISKSSSSFPSILKSIDK